MKRADLYSNNYSSIITIEPATKKGRKWLDHHCAHETNMPLVAEHRYGIDILHAALADGLVLRDRFTGRCAVAD